MWMEWSIPIQKLEVGKVYVNPIQKTLKPICSLSYKDGPFSLQNLNILLPPLPIKEYDSASGKLILNLSENIQTAAKLFALQEYLLATVFLQQKLWFPESNRTKEQIQNLFQPFLEDTYLHLYCPIQIQEKKHSLYIWKNGEWTCLSSPGVIQKGDIIRVGLRMQGISFQLSPQTSTWTGRFRVQHRIFCIYHCNDTIQKV